eukprot:Skav225943  [mRNA]  locus=scaffold1500:502285:507187:- [translate_table: standard]
MRTSTVHPACLPKAQDVGQRKLNPAKVLALPLKIRHLDVGSSVDSHRRPHLDAGFAVEVPALRCKRVVSDQTGRGPCHLEKDTSHGAGETDVGLPAKTSIWSPRMLRARGLPFTATSDQVLEFFSGYGVTGRIHMKSDMLGRPSGEVFVEFVSNDEASAAGWLMAGAGHGLKISTKAAYNKRAMRTREASNLQSLKSFELLSEPQGLTRADRSVGEGRRYVRGASCYLGSIHQWHPQNNGSFPMKNGYGELDDASRYLDKGGKGSNGSYGPWKGGAAHELRVLPGNLVR